MRVHVRHCVVVNVSALLQELIDSYSQPLKAHIISIHIPIHICYHSCRHG